MGKSSIPIEPIKKNMMLVDKSAVVYMAWFSVRKVLPILYVKYVATTAKQIIGILHANQLLPATAIAPAIINFTKGGCSKFAPAPCRMLLAAVA